MAKKESNAEDIMRRRRRRRRQVIGFFVCVLAVIGLISVISGGARLVRRATDDSAERSAYEQRLTYVVMLDMLPFDSLSGANQFDLLESCIWAALFKGDSTLYERDDVGALLLPSAEVDLYAAQLFGPDYKLKHTTFESEGMTFLYDDETARYTIPVTGQVGNYTPSVVEISGTKTVKRVSVGYLRPYASATDFASNRDVNKPVKYYDYLFTRAADGNYYLTSMEESAWVSDVEPESDPVPMMPDPQTDLGMLVTEAAADEGEAAEQELAEAQNQGEEAAKEPAAENEEEAAEPEGGENG